MKTSNLFSLDWRDVSKGLIVASGGAVVTGVQNVLNAGSLTFNWKEISIAAMAAGVSYLGKNFFTAAQNCTKDTTNDTSSQATT